MTTSAYTIRAATAADAETIKQMVRSAPLNPNAINWQHFHVLEVVEQGQPKIVSIGMLQKEGEIWEIDSVTTRREYRGKGYAGAIVRTLMENAPRPLYLLAETDLVEYYKRLGFEGVEREYAPTEMRDQVAWLDQMFGDSVRYHIMGAFAQG